MDGGANELVLCMSFDLKTTFPTLKNAPITEATIDLRVARNSNVTMEDLAGFRAGLENEFGEKIERRSLQASIEIEQGEARVVSPGARPDGYVFHASNEPLTAQVSFDGFTLTRRKPYQEWAVFIARAQELWRRYLKVSRPTGVTRLAVRNVNRIGIDPNLDLFGFILTGPQIAMALPQNMIGFFMRLLIPDQSGAVAIINETLGEIEEGDSAPPVIFDIEAFRETEIDPMDAGIWNVLNELRHFKNRIFFNSLTAKAIERYR